MKTDKTPKVTPCEKIRQQVEENLDKVLAKKEPIKKEISEKDVQAALKRINPDENSMDSRG